MATSTPVSACIITLNEASNLPRCLAGLHGLVDEIVVVDSGSSDATRDIAAAAGARVIEHAWEGFVGQKNFAMAQCRNEWILSIDADEEISPPLREELEALFAELSTRSDRGIWAYALPRQVWYRGRWIHHGDWYPDYVTRLFHRGEARFAGGAVHESLQHRGQAVRLNSPLYHYTYKDEADHIARIRHYSTLWAEGKSAAGRRASPLSPYLRAAFRFLRAAILKGGYRDGRLGWRIAALSAYEVFLKYSKLRQLNVKSERR